MSLNRRRSLIGLGGAALTGLVAPRQALACFCHGRKVRVVCSQPKGFSIEPRKLACCNEQVGTIVIRKDDGTALTAPYTFKKNDIYRFRISAPGGGSFVRANMAIIRELNGIMAWQQVSAGWEGNILVVRAYPDALPGSTGTITSNGLNVSVQAGDESFSCWERWPYPVTGPIIYQL